MTREYPQTKQTLIEGKHRRGLGPNGPNVAHLRRCHPRGNGEAPVYHPDLILDYVNFHVNPGFC